MIVAAFDVPALVAAIGTVGAFAAALWQIRNERRRRIEADEELRRERHLEQARLIAAYMGEEEPAEPQSSAAGVAGRRHLLPRRQAPLPEQAAADRDEPDEDTALRGRTAFYLVNNSPEPVYSVVVAMVFVQGAGPHTLEDMIDLNLRQYGRIGPVTTVSIIPGGLYRVWIDGIGWHRILSGRAGVEIAFSDKAGANWIRRANGQLDELETDPLTYLRKWNFVGPYDYQTPERVPVS